MLNELLCLTSPLRWHLTLDTRPPVPFWGLDTSVKVCLYLRFPIKINVITENNGRMSQGRVKIKSNIFTFVLLSHLLTSVWFRHNNEISLEQWNMQKKKNECRWLFLSFSEKNSSKHPVGFLTVGNKTAPLLTQKGVEFFHSRPVTHDKLQWTDLNYGGLAGSKRNISWPAPLPLTEGQPDCSHPSLASLPQLD